MVNTAIKAEIMIPMPSKDFKKNTDIKCLLPKIKKGGLNPSL